MIHVNKIQNQVLKAHIQTEGYVIYSVPDLVFELLRIESKRNKIAQIINQGAKTENLSELTVQYLTAILATTWLREPKCYAT